MSLQARVLLIISAAFIIAMGCVYATSRLIFIRGLEEIERQNTAERVDQALGALGYMISDLESDTADWAAWDDTYAFIEDQNQEYIDSNLVSETFVTLGLHLMVYIDSAGDIVYSKAYDVDEEEEIPFPEDLLKHLSEDSPFLSDPDRQSVVSGIIQLKQGPLMIAAQPILTSENLGPARGTLIFARYLNSTVIEELSQITMLPISIHTIDNLSSPDLVEASATLLAEGGTLVKPLDSENVGGYTLLSDVYKRASFILKIDASRNTYQLGELVSSYYILAVLGVGLLVVLAAWVLIQRRVLSRVALLIRGVNRIAETGDTTTRIALTGKDEVSTIAGTINGMLGALEEVSSEIRESERRYRLLAENVMDVIWATDKDMTFTYVSPSVYQLSGFTPEELIGKKVNTFLDNATIQDAQRAFNSELIGAEEEDVSKGIPSYEIPLTKKDGSRVWTEIRLSTIRDGSGQVVGFVGVARDIGERRQAEQLYRTLANSATVGVYIYQDGFKFVNPQFMELTGHSEEELIHMRSWEIVHEDDRQHTRENAVNMLKGKLQSPYEYRVIHPDGDIRWAMETVRSIEYNGERATLGNFMDITENKLAREQLERLYAEEIKLRQSLEEEIAKRIEFTRALVHELKTPITPVLAAVELLLEEIDDERVMRLVQSIDRSASNLNQRIDELLDLARGETDMLQIDIDNVDTLQLFNDISYEMIPVALRSSLELKFDLPSTLPIIQADRGRIRQVVTNLLNNAFKFTPEGGKIVLTAKSDKSNLTIEITDNGSGINKEDQERLFEPYFRRTGDRERLSGLGLGLALSKSFVELHGGEIWVNSEPGVGSTFGFTLPIKQPHQDE